MNTNTTTYLAFSKKELNGILILFFIISMILGFPYCYRVVDKPVAQDFSRFKKEIALFEASAIDIKPDKRKWESKAPEKFRKPEYFSFDPNSVSETQWIKLGLSARQAKVIQNYRSKGGKFYKNIDLKKIYSITETQYQGLEPYIKIESSFPNSYSDRKMPESKRDFAKQKRAVIIVELNSADSAMIDQIRGIGPAFASRIIRFRDRLGGFYNKEQLREVYGMDSIRYSLLEDQIKVDRSAVTKIDINVATFEKLKNHPYLTYKQINAILQYRKQHGNYTQSNDLTKVLITNEEIIRKIEPYLSF